MYIDTLHVFLYKLYISSYNRSYINNHQLTERHLVPLSLSLMTFILAAENKLGPYLPNNLYT